MGLGSWIKKKLQEPVNKGSEQDRRSALQAVAEYTSVLLGLSTGSVVLSATFLDRFYHGEALWLLTSSWSLFALSILLGLLTMGQRIRQLAESELQVRGGSLELTSLLQWTSFLAAVVLFFTFALQNLPTDSSACCSASGAGQ